MPGKTLDDLKPLRLLVAVDGSAGSIIALQRAAQLAKAEAASEVVVIYVLEQGSAGTLTSEADPGAERRAWSILEDAAVFMRNEGVDVSTELLRGPAATRILEYADRFAPNMLLVGSKGMGHSRSEAGSVADAVSKRSRWPVLVVRS